MFYLPLFHNLKQRQVLIVGGGTTALRKLRWILRTEAQITVIAIQAHTEIMEYAESGQLQLLQRAFTDNDVHADLSLVISATNNAAVNRQVHEVTQRHRVLINCVDQPELCNVIFPSIVDRFPILVAISSMGSAPTLARLVRGWIEARLPATLGKLAEFADSLRDEVRTQLSDVEERKNYWENVLRGEAAERALAGDLDSARDLARNTLANGPSSLGTVALVGAGPGDPELITLKALRLLQGADVILYDQLANTAILDYARRDAEFIYVGKQGPKPGSPPDRPDNRSNQQQAINELIVQHAQAGAQVVRLKGGDPFIYGRGGEELEAALAADLPVMVVPGITAALGAASYAGIPLTYRNLSQSVRFVTGHRVKNAINLDWPEFAKPQQTLVIYMGLVGLAEILSQLVTHGADATMPAALVEHATLPEQRTIVGTIGTLADKVARVSPKGPCVVIIGEVVALRAAVLTNSSLDEADQQS